MVDSLQDSTIVMNKFIVYMLYILTHYGEVAEKWREYFGNHLLCFGNQHCILKGIITALLISLEINTIQLCVPLFQHPHLLFELI